MKRLFLSHPLPALCNAIYSLSSVWSFRFHPQSASLQLPKNNQPF